MEQLNLRTMTALVLTTTALLGAQAQPQESIPVSNEKRLTSFLVARYQTIGTRGRPVINASDPTPVSLGLGLIQMDLDEKEKILFTSMWVKMNWQDVYLHWDPADFGGVRMVRLLTQDIWLPDVMLINTADPKYDLRNTQVIVNNEGNVSWVPHQLFRSSCSIDVSLFPFDDQICHMWFASWTHTSVEIEISLAELGLDLSTFTGDYKDSSEWAIYDKGAEKIKGTENDPASEYDVLQFRLHLRRKLVFRSYLLTLPCVFLATLTLVVFCLPPERPDRTGLSMSIFGSFLLLLLIMTESAPTTASSVPKLGLYYCFNMVLIMLSVFLSSLVVNVDRKAQTNIPVNRWLRLLLLDAIGRLLLIQSSSCPRRNTCRRRHARDPDEQEARDPMIHLAENAMDPKFNGPVSAINSIQNASAALSANNGYLETYFIQMERQVCDIRLCVRSLLDHVEKSVASRQVSNESGRDWKMVARVLDRLFFIIYLTGIIMSLWKLFPTPPWMFFVNIV